MWLLLNLIGSLLISVIIGAIAARILIKRTVGELIIDTTNPDKDIYRIELGEHFEELAKRKHITLRVVHSRTSQN